MKVAIIFSEGIKQINLTPENDDEKHALRLISPNDNIELAVKSGSFGEEKYKPFTVDVNRCQGGYLRAFESKESVMLVLTPKKEVVKIDDPRTIDERVHDFVTANLFYEQNDQIYTNEYARGYNDGVRKYIESEISINH